MNQSLGDLGGDGELDGVFANPKPHNSEVWLNDGTGLFVDTGQQLTQYGHGVGLGDWDGDGDLDVFVGSLADRPEIWLNETVAPASDANEGMIAFVSTRDGNPEICVMDVGSGAVTRLTEDPGSDDSPALSPDGRRTAASLSR